MAKYPLNLGSTFKEFLNVLNTNTEDTEGIINGAKKVKKLSLGEEDELGNIEIIAKDNKKALSIYGESILLDVSHDDETSSLQIGDIYSEIYSENGRIHLEAGNGISLHSNKNDTARIEIDATNDSENGKILIQSNFIQFIGEIDFTHATVVGLPSSGSGGTLAIEVEELPTENIDDSKIYILNEIKNAEVYYFDGLKYCTIPSVVLDIVGVTPAINHYVVNELPTNAEITDLQTFSVINCYIFNNVAYVYGNAGAGNMWLTVSAIFAQMGNPTEDKGRVYDLADTSVEIGLYAYYEEFSKFYVYSENEWKEISDSTSDRHILRLSGNNGVLSDEQYQSLVDNFSNTTIIYTLGNDTIVFNAIATMVGLYVSTFSMGYEITMLAITPDKTWVVYTDNLSEDFIRRTGTNDIWANNTFNNTNTFSESSSVAFNCPVDFTNATINGLKPNAIIDVANLPTENINENAIYRVHKAVYYAGKTPAPTDMFKCNAVNELPTTGNPAVVFDSSLNPTFVETYYVASENKAYGYVDEILAQAGASVGQTITVGWYPVDMLFPLINIEYNGIIYSTDKLSSLGLFLLVEFDLYTYKNGMAMQINGSGLNAEQVQEMINTAINGALEGNY